MMVRNILFLTLPNVSEVETTFRNLFLLPSSNERREEAYFVGPVRDLRLALPGSPAELASLLLSYDDRSRSDFHSLWL
jgi:hypothetical protein